MIKKLISCIREYTIYTILSPLFMMGEAIMEVLIPFYMADLIDLGIKQGDMTVVKALGVKLILFACISVTCGVLGGLVSAKASAGFAKNLQHDMFHNIQTFSFSNIDKFSPAGLVTRMTTDVTNVQMAFMMSIRMAFRAPTMSIFALVMAFRINSKLAMSFIVVMPFLVAALLFMMSKAHPLFQKVFTIYDKLNKVVQENLRGVRVIKAFVREDEEISKFKETSQDLYNTNIKAEILMAFTSPVMEIAMYSCMLLISWIGAKLVVSSVMTDGQLMSMFTYIMQILMNLMMLGVAIVMFVIAKAAAERIVEVLDETPDITDAENPVFEVKDGSIKFENVNFGYGNSKDCLTDINLDIKSGETIGIIGGTGSGKSSLVQLIPRLYDVRSGRVLVGGEDVRNIDLEVLRTNIAMVLQKNILFSGTLAENLRWGNENASMEDLERVCRLACADGFIREMPDGYNSKIEQGGSNVSGGQRQRLCIARALLANPKVLIMDDSTSAVDTATEAQILRAFREDIPDVTKIIIAQRVSSVMSADRIVVLDDGKICGIGTHEELLNSNQIYQEVYESQTKGGDFDEPARD